MPFISRKTDQFSYFARQLRDRAWRNKSVLDFGGNVGNILKDPESTIAVDRYWCVDVVREAIDKGRAIWPKAHWVHYDRYCFFFNPHGVAKLPLPNLGRKFDVVVAYSVFTNTPRSEMLDLVDQLTSIVADRGALAFTFIDPDFVAWPHTDRGTNLQWRVSLEGDKVPPGAVRRAAKAEWCILVNGDDLYVESEAVRHYPAEEQRTQHVFYSADYMRRLFPHAEVRPPVNDEGQHCCVIRKG